MPAPAAPRKKGTLTQQTATTSRTRTKAANTDEAELTRKLERVTLGESSTVAAENVASSTSRTTAKTLTNKQPVPAPPATPLQQIAAASAKVNNILKSFGAARQGASNSLKALYSDAGSALDVLRKHKEHVEPKKRMEIEKAALILVGHCLDHGLYDAALKQLKATKSALSGLYTTSPAKEEDKLCSQLQDLSLRAIKPSSQQAKVSAGLRNVHDAVDLFKLPLPFSDEDVSLGELELQDVVSTLAIFGHHVISYILKLRFANAFDNRERITMLASVLSTSDPGGQPLVIARGARQAGVEDLKKTDSTLSAIYTMLMKALSEDDVTNNADIYDVLRLRCYALECLLENRSYFAKSQQQADNGSDKAVQLVLSQAHRAVTQYCKSATQDLSTSEADLAVKISQPIISVLDAMQVTISKESLQRCPIHSEVFDLLSKIAAKGSDEALSNAVSGILARPEQAEESEVVEMSPEDLRSKVLDVCAQVVAQTAKLDKWIKSDFQPTTYSLRGVQDAVSQLCDLRNKHITDESPAELVSKIGNTLERAQFYPVRALRVSSPHMSQATAEDFTALAAKTLEAAEAATWLSKDLNLASVDALLLLARRAFKLDDVSSYRPAFLLISRAAAVSASVSDEKAGEAYKSTSSAAYRIGSTLYDGDKAANAIPFLQLACETSSTGLEKATSDSHTRDLQQACPQRYELLGLAHASIKEKTEALAAYQLAIEAGVRNNIAAHSRLADDTSLFKVISRYTRMAVLDMFIKPEDSALHTTMSKRGFVLNDENQGALLKLQIKALDNFKSKQEAVDAITVWLDQAKEAYERAGNAVQVSRLLLQQLELSVTVTGSLDPTQLAAQADLIVQSIKQATSTSQASTQFANEYQALSQIFIAFDAVRRNDPTASRIVAAQAKEAMALLRGIIPSPLSQQADAATSPEGKAGIRSQVAARTASTVRTLKRSTTSAPVSGTVASTRLRQTSSRSITSAVPAASLRKPLSPKSATTTNANSKLNVTPPRKSHRSGLTSGAATKSASSPVTHNVLHLFAEPEMTLNALAVLASLLAIFEHTFLRLGCLRLLRRLQEGHNDDDYIKTSSELIHEYTQLGKYDRAASIIDQTQSVVDKATTVPAVKVLFLLRKAIYLATCGTGEESDKLYQTAYAVETQTAEESTDTSSTKRIIARTELLHRSALAAHTFSQLQFTNGNATWAIDAALQSLRLANRALSNLSRITRQSNTRLQTERDSAAGEEFEMPVVKFGTGIHNHNAGTLGWDVTSQLVSTMLWLSQLYNVRGSLKPAVYFLHQAADLAQTMNAPRLHAKVIARQIDLDTAAGRHAEANEKLVQLVQMSKADGGLSAIDVMLVNADTAARSGDHEAAQERFAAATKALAKLDKGYIDTELQLQSPIRPAKISQSRLAGVGVLPALQRRILRSQIALMSLEADIETLKPFLTKLYDLAHHHSHRADNSLLQAKIHLASILAKMRMDPLMGLLPESILSIPSLGHIESSSHTSQVKEALQLLNDVEDSLSQTSLHRPQTSSANHAKNAFSALAAIRLVRATLSALCDTHAPSIAAALQAGVSLALRREMLDSLSNKLRGGILQDDLRWPAAVTAVTASENSLQHRHNRYMLELSSTADEQSQSAPLLPAGWSVVSLHLSQDCRSILAVRYGDARSPVIYQTPLDRLGRRESDENLLTFEVANAELVDIVRQSNESAQAAKDMKTSEDRKAWWKLRKELEARLHDLLINIEDRWFGMLRHVLFRPVTLADEAGAKFLAQLEQILHKAILTTKDNKSTKFETNAEALESFLSLKKSASDEDLEDLLHFVVDSYQFAGVNVACDEIDVDQVVVDIRSALDDYHASRKEEAPLADEHLFIILDKSLHLFPWESLPCLAGRSISRLPAMSFLQDRLELQDSHTESDQVPHPYPGMHINRSNVYYTLNPGGDLKHTQSEFETWLSTHGWQGTSGRAPVEEELKRALIKHDLYIYFGHGGGEQYIRPRIIRDLPRCATALLWGCSSGHIAEQGDFEGTGTPWMYMMAGSPAVVANLWDVTDKDIDRFTKATFEHFGLTSEDSIALSLPAAIAKARSACSLRYLNGAAPVVWGIPKCCVFIALFIEYGNATESIDYLRSRPLK